ncbi:MAG: hypothetical protein WBD36_02715 [Bacteroidota bacterium]
MKRSMIIGIVFLVALSMLPSRTAACPVCYGDTNSAMAEGVNAAILVLLGITGSVLGLLSAVFLRIRKRMKLTMNGSVDYPSMN